MTTTETARRTLFVAVLFASALTAHAAAGKDRLSRAAAAKAGSGRAEMVEVIVTYDRMPGAAETDAARLLQGKVRRAFGRLPMRTLRIPAHRLKSLASRPGVRFVTLDEPVLSSSNSARGTAKKPTAGQAGYIAANPSIVVAVLDTGVADHEDLSVLGQVDFTSSSMAGAVFRDEFPVQAWDGSASHEWSARSDYSRSRFGRLHE